MRRSRRVTFAVAAVASLVAAPLALAAGPSPTDTVATTTASVLPDQTPVTNGWLQPDFVSDPVSPVHQFTPQPGQTTATDRIFPTVMRVDDKLANPLDRWYMWVWRHGTANTAALGGGLDLLTAPRLEGPWTDRGLVTPQPLLPPSAPSYWQTGGDVVWSPLHRMFYTVPHTIPMDSYLLQSPDGVTWQLSNVSQPVLRLGPAGSYDDLETGYGRLLRLDQPDGSEKWIWLYRSGRKCPACNDTWHEYYTLSVATADDITGPWTKASDNPVFDPYAGNVNNASGGLFGVIAFAYRNGWYQMLWQDFVGNIYLSRSQDLRTWNDFGGVGVQSTRPTGTHRSTPVFTIGQGPGDVITDGADLAYDDQVGTLTLVYLGWDADNFENPPGVVTVNLARSLSGQGPLVGRNE